MPTSYVTCVSQIKVVCLAIEASSFQLFRPQLAPSQSIVVIHDHDLALPLHTVARPRRLSRPTLCASRRSCSPRRWRFLSKCRADGLELSVVHHCSCSAVKLLHLVIFFLGLPALHIAITEFFFVEELTSTHMNCELYKLL